MATPGTRARAPLDDLFPNNIYVQRLLEKVSQLGVRLERSEVPEQWLYHPGDRTIYVWEPDLHQQSLSYLVVILAHELGHVIDFDRHPQHRELTRHRLWVDVPPQLELNAFVNAFLLLQELEIPVTLGQYCLMIEEPMASTVQRELQRYLCCLSAQPEAPAAS